MVIIKAAGRPTSDPVKQLQFYYHIKYILRHEDSNGMINYGWKYYKNNGSPQDVTNENKVIEAITRLYNNSNLMIEYGLSSVSSLNSLKRKYYQYHKDEKKLIAEIIKKQPDIETIELPISWDGVFKIKIK